jgi:4-aminobutyrate aminotransferase-like enzyme
VGDIRGLGLLIGIELVEPDGTTPLVGAAAQVANSAMKAGVLVLPAGDLGQVVELAPPVVLTTDQEVYAVDVLENAIRSLS